MSVIVLFLHFILKQKGLYAKILQGKKTAIMQQLLKAPLKRRAIVSIQDYEIEMKNNTHFNPSFIWK